MKTRRTSAVCRCMLVFALVTLACACNKKDKTQPTIPTTAVRQGTFYIDLYEEGEIQATQSKIISSPDISWRYGGMMKLATIIEDGSEVQAGDTVMTFDPSDVRKAIVDSEQRLELHYADLEKMKAQHASNLENMLSDLEVSKISLEISRLNLESAQHEADITKKEIQLNLEQAEIALEQAENQIENTRRIQREEMQQMQLNIRQAQRELEEGQQTLERLTVKAPNPGIVIIRRSYTTQAKYKEGDQVWSGQQMMELPNLHELKVELKINEVDISKISKGLKVMVRPDAFSDSLYYGEVYRVANLAVNKNNESQIKVFPVDVLITSEVNRNLSARPDLMPGLTVSCRIIIDEIPNVMYVPLNCVFSKDNEEFVYLKTIGGFKKTIIRTGQRNTDYVIVEEGLNAKDEIAMVNPFATEEISQSSSQTDEQ